MPNGLFRTVRNNIIDPCGQCVTCELVRVYSLVLYVTLRVQFATIFFVFQNTKGCTWFRAIP